MGSGSRPDPARTALPSFDAICPGGGNQVLAVSSAGDANASTNRLHAREVSERLFMSLLDSSLPIPALQRMLEPVALLRQRLDVDPLVYGLLLSFPPIRKFAGRGRPGCNGDACEA